MRRCMSNRCMSSKGPTKLIHELDLVPNISGRGVGPLWEIHPAAPELGKACRTAVGEDSNATNGPGPPRTEVSRAGRGLHADSGITFRRPGFLGAPTRAWHFLEKALPRSNKDLTRLRPAEPANVWSCWPYLFVGGWAVISDQMSNSSSIVVKSMCGCGS